MVALVLLAFSWWSHDPPEGVRCGKSRADVCSDGGIVRIVMQRSVAKAAVQKRVKHKPAELTGMTLFMRGATSIDALSTGFTISSYDAKPPSSVRYHCSSHVDYVLYRHAYRYEGRRIVFCSCCNC